MTRRMQLWALVVAWTLSGCGGGKSTPGRDAGDADGDADADADGDSDADADADADGDRDAGPLPDAGPPPACDPVGPGQPPDGAAPGELSLPNPTIQNASILWALDGDDDLDATVRVRYRPQGAGDDAWRAAMPLRRVPAGMTSEGFGWDSRFAGSLFDLEPATTYDVELWLQDPDGGCVIELRSVTTRPLPAPMPGAPVTAVDPGSLEDALSNAQPGDVLELAAGDYGGFDVYADGEPGQPIVIRGEPGAQVDGTVRIDGRRHVWIEGLTINGSIRFSDSEAVVIVRNTVTTDEDGIASWRRSEDAYIADNRVFGASSWTESAVGAQGDNIGEGILVNGPGHVVEHNLTVGFRDNISFVEGEGLEQWSIDVLDNDIVTATDDGIEADFCNHNCRIMRNRITNCFVALSAQPTLGGPQYFIRNVVYNAIYIAAFKLHRESNGDVALHNTIVKNGHALAAVPSREHDFTFFRNNLVIGGPGDDFNGWPSGEGWVLYLPDSGPHCSYDYDALGSTTGSFEGQIGETWFSSLAELQASTTEQHAIQIDLDVFAAAVDYPGTPFPEVDPPDLRLADSAAAVDAAEPIANVNDGWRGAAPDIGAYELGGPVPAYGPR